MPQNQGPAGVKRPFGPRGAGNDQLSSAIAGALADPSYRRSVCRHGETLGARLSREQAESASARGNFIANEYSQQRTARTPEPPPAGKVPNTRSVDSARVVQHRPRDNTQPRIVILAP